MEHTVKNPLELKWDGEKYKVNKPNQDTQKLISLENAEKMLYALKAAYRCSGERGFLTKPVLDEMLDAINIAESE